MSAPPVVVHPPDEHLGCYLMVLPALQALLAGGVEAGFAEDPFELGLPIVSGIVLAPEGQGHVADRYVRAALWHGGALPATRYALRVVPSTRYAGKLVVAPWARAESKRAPFTWWREYLAGAEYALQAPASARGYAEQFLREVPGGAFDPTDDSATWIADLAGARRVVSVDTGSAHMADALGVPTTTVFVTTDPALFAPYWSRDFVEAG